MTMPRCSMNPGGGKRERVAPVEVLEMFLCENTFQFKGELLSLPDKIVLFPAIPPFSAQERDNKHLTTAMED